MQLEMDSALTPTFSPEEPPRRGRTIRQSFDIHGSVTFPSADKSFSLSLGSPLGRGLG
jgi:hypothetical protein